jgi:poly(3-hydroxybutyrate) depolymerase
MRAVWIVVFASACGSSGGGDGGTQGGTTSTSAGDDAVTDATSPAESSAGADTLPASTSDADSEGGSGVDGSTSGGGPVGSAGCGLAASDPSVQWSSHTIDVGGVLREYWVWLPSPYDPQRAYPVVYQFHGCSDGEDRWNNNPPVQDQSGADAIHIRGKAVQSCWDSGSPESPDVAFFDALVGEVEATWCADAERRFATGYSSGSFMTHRLGCARGDMLRGVATIAGGQGDADCTGPVAALLIHDSNDSVVDISASVSARAEHLARNGCDVEAPTTAVEPAPCQAYAGCDEGLPVVWCETSGQDHSRQDGLAAPAFWGFLSALPSS